MKKLFLVIILFLSGCKKGIIVDYNLEKLDTKFYVVNSNNSIECINIEYKVIDEEDIFFLYTIYQNYLPLGYFSPAHANINLIDCYTEGKYTYYEVDFYIDIVKDLDLFKECLSKTNKIYGFGNAVFLKNGNEVA